MAAANLNLQRISGQFPSDAAALPVPTFPPITLQDTITFGLGWSSGVQTVVPISAQPTITKPWTVLGWSIAFSIYLQEAAAQTGPISGQLGRLFGGLILAGSVTPQHNSPLSLSQLPSDPTTIQTLWDGSTDTTPPWSTLQPPYSTPHVSTTSLQLPVPLLMAASDKLGMGIWLTPSLTSPTPAGNAFNLAVEASYAIQYTTD